MSPARKSLSFDAMAELYDETRTARLGVCLSLARAPDAAVDVPNQVYFVVVSR